MITTIKSTTFDLNVDDGCVLITHVSKHNEVNACRIPVEDLREYVAHLLRNEIIGRLERASSRHILEWTTGMGQLSIRMANG